MNKIQDITEKLMGNEYFTELLQYFMENFFKYGIIILLILVVIPAWINNARLKIAKWKVMKNPNEENAINVCKALKRYMVSIYNHPSEWEKYRKMFYVINGSPLIPTPLKHDIIAALKKRNLYINTRIIDNYGKKETAKN